VSLTHPKPGVQERIMLHLRDYGDHRESVEVPFSVSQMGIANAVSIARSNVPRAIAGLREQGQLIERQAHVTGVARKRKAYFLTDEGLRASDEIYRTICQHPIRLIQSNEDEAEATIGESCDISPFPLRVVDVIRYLLEDGTLDLRQLSGDLVARDLTKSIEKQLVTMTTDLPRPTRFFGRARELESMVGLLDARPTCLLVQGIAGIGKTALAYQLVQEFTHRRNLLYHRCQDRESSKAFIESAADWVSQVSDTSLADYVAATPAPRAKEVARLLLESLAESPALIVIDDHHKVSDEDLHEIVLHLVRGLEMTDELGVVVLTRSFREILPSKDSEGAILTLAFPLEGLDPDACRNLLTSFSELDPAQFQQIYAITRGHPLALELVNKGATTSTYHGTLEKYVETEILARLTSAQKRVLSALCIFREPIPIEEIPFEGDAHDVIEDLVSRGLARVSDGGNFDVHDLVREFVLRGMDPSLKRDLHTHAIKHYRTSSSRGDLELLHHLTFSGGHDEAARMVVDRASELIRIGQLELIDIIASLDANLVSPRTWSEVQMFLGDMLALKGDWDGAELNYQSAFEQAEQLGVERLVAKLQSRRADIDLHRGRTTDALDKHAIALKGYEKHAEHDLAGRTYTNIGAILRQKGDNKAALEAYQQCKKVIDSAGSSSHHLVSTSLLLARGLLELGEVEFAREAAFQAHDLSVVIEDQALIARSHAVLGRLHARGDDQSLALHHYSEALDGLSDIGDPRSVVEVSLMLGEVLIDSGNLDGAIERYREALAMAEENDLRMLMGEILARLGGTHPDRKQRTEDLNRALTLFRGLGAKNRMKEVQAQVHRLLMQA